MIVVADTNALIGMAKGQIFHILQELYGNLRIPPGVWEEIVVNGRGRPGEAEVRSARDRWLTVQDVPMGADAPFVHINTPADRECLALAHSLPADRLITDDRAIREAAARHGLPTVFTLDVVVLAKRTGFIPSTQVVMDTMRRSGFRIPEPIYQAALVASSENSSA